MYFNVDINSGSASGAVKVSWLISQGNSWRVIVTLCAFLLGWLTWQYDSAHRPDINGIEMLARIASVVLLALSAAFALNGDFAFATFLGAHGMLEAGTTTVLMLREDGNGLTESSVSPRSAARVTLVIAGCFASLLLLLGLYYNDLWSNFQYGVDNGGGLLVVAGYLACLVVAFLLMATMNHQIAHMHQGSPEQVDSPISCPVLVVRDGRPCLQCPPSQAPDPPRRMP
jgi:hypothetical protein